MRQGRRSVSEFAIDFQTLATSTSWNAGAIFDTFLNGLSDEIKDELVSHDLPSTCEELIDLAIRIDTRLQQRPGRRSFSIRPRLASNMATTQPTTSTSEPRAHARLTPAERQRRMTTRSCLYCGQLQLPTTALHRPLVANALDGRWLANITHISEPAQTPSPVSNPVEEFPDLSAVPSQYQGSFQSLSEHTSHVHRVLQRLLENQLFVKAEKCDFYRDTMGFLGYVVSAGTLKMDYPKIKAVVEWPTPSSRHHRNLEYLRSAKRLNPRQARWSLFFTRFDFTLSYRPGHKNVKPDALSRLFSTDEDPKETDTILPSRRIIGAAQLEIESVVIAAQGHEPTPSQCHPNLLFVPTSVRSQVLQWGHSSCLSCHPGSNRTLSFIARRFWWPTLREDTNTFVATCSICAQNKTSTRPPAGLLQPLPVPKRPWSHISIDFITGLPPSAGNTAILTVVDRFSKAVHFIPLAGLPSAKDTAKIMIQHVFKLHGLPSEVVSDRGPQFTSSFWRAFCKLLGASVCLSSGFHPQTNDQTERANQQLETVLRCVASQNPTTWSEQLPWAEYAINSHISSSTGQSPFECSLCYQPPLFLDQEREVGVPSAEAFVRRCRRSWRLTRSALLRTSSRMKRQADKHR
ncbi:hypothetical protein AALO_G00069940 [Alosa alosa]|uniref:Gypsy retrotransposon integrase-like protein 1 n=1 Tax=Alosa alosa TaxID=278164 RepID=A0AAV6H5P7_9TELE|nr:hypothetical protein AALO_G00069940 [Alosa alosa]